MLHKDLSYTQRVFGNKWTEIQRWIQAGRIPALMVLQDKTVNRFTRLRVKRANHEPMASENNSNKKRIQRHGTVKGTMDVKELVLLLAKNSMNHQSLLLVKDCATPPALKKEVSAAGERDKEGREVGEKKTKGG
ncbi:hypothetical protein Bca4012_029638 [Brassica carinata]